MRLYYKNKIKIIFFLDSVTPLGIQSEPSEPSKRECVRCIYKCYKLASDY